MSDDDDVEGLSGVIVENHPVCTPQTSEALQLQFCKTSPIIVQNGQPKILYLPFAINSCESKNLGRRNQG
jgi:hypothetical protein